jgi:hypothetical protein
MTGGDMFTPVLSSLLLLLVAAPTARSSRSSGPHPQLPLNVRDYGAIGDGEHDDTDAIQRALHFAGRATLGNYAPIAQGGDSSLQRPTLLFPTGAYLISRTLFPGGGVDGSAPCDARVHDTNQSCVPAAWLRGESALIKQVNSSADILYYSRAWRWQVSGLHFVGGRNHIHTGNNDTDKSIIVVTDCLFANASSAAIRTMGPGWWTEGEGPYFRGSASTQYTIRSSQFFANEQVVVNWCDYMVVEDVWVERAGPNGSYAKALFENHDKLILLRMLGVPQPIAGHDQRWIDNHNHGNQGGVITARDSRFGGEGGGFTVCVNFASFLCAPAGRSNWPAGMPGGYKNCQPPPKSGVLPDGTRSTGLSGVIVLDSCMLDSHGNHQRNSSIYLEAIPSQLIIRGCYGFDYAPRYENPAIQIIRVDPDLDLDGAQLDFAATRPGLLRYELDPANVFVPDGGGSPPIRDPSFPQQLWPYRVERVEADGPPTVGVWRRHQVVHARPNASTTARGWECVTAGKPGTWRPFGEGGAVEEDSMVSSLERLAKLRESGALSDAEFVRGKTAVMAWHEMA